MDTGVAWLYVTHFRHSLRSRVANVRSQGRCKSCLAPPSIAAVGCPWSHHSYFRQAPYLKCNKGSHRY